MSSFLFLTFCLYVFCCSGLHFSAFILLGLSFGGFLQLLLQISTRALHGFHRACLGLWWCRFLTLSSNRPRIAAQGRVWFFLPRTSLPLPLKGEGRDFAHLWGFGFSLAVACGNCWSQTAHTASTGPVWGFPGVVPLPSLQNRTQGLTGPRLVLTAVSWCASFAAALLAGAPGGNLPPRGWAGSCKAASRFSQCRPKSIRWWAAFR